MFRRVNQKIKVARFLLRHDHSVYFVLLISYLLIYKIKIAT